MGEDQETRIPEQGLLNGRDGTNYKKHENLKPGKGNVRGNWRIQLICTYLLSSACLM
jgi:hypothetical protein